MVKDFVEAVTNLFLIVKKLLGSSNLVLRYIKSRCCNEEITQILCPDHQSPVVLQGDFAILPGFPHND